MKQNEKISIGIYLYKRKAWYPTLVRIGNYGFRETGPIHKTEIVKNEIVKKVKELRDQGNESVKRPHFLPQKSELLKVSRARSWKELSRNGEAYGIYWNGEKILLLTYKRDEKGRFIQDVERDKAFPLDATVEEIVDQMLDDYQVLLKKREEKSK